MGQKKPECPQFGSQTATVAAGRPDDARRTRAGGDTNMGTKHGQLKARGSETNALERAMRPLVGLVAA